jgi:hypothetical protein
VSLTNSFYLIPNGDARPRDPITGKPLAPKGETKPRSSYWLRRLRDGDVTEGKQPKAAAVAPNKGDAK